MNEKIRELAEQAGITKANLSDGNMSYNEFEKFAELIVRECLDNCMAANDRDRIREHFGVEL